MNGESDLNGLNKVLTQPEIRDGDGLSVAKLTQKTKPNLKKVIDGSSEKVENPSRDLNIKNGRLQYEKDPLFSTILHLRETA